MIKATTAILTGLILVYAASLRAQEPALPKSGKLTYSLTTQDGYRPDARPRKTKVTVYWKGEKVREESRTPEGNRWLLLDGKTAFRYDPKTRAATPMKSMPRLRDVVSGTPASFRDIKRVEKGSFLGQPCDLQVAESPLGQGKAHIWISRKTGICLKFTVQGRFGHIVKEVTSIKTDIPLSDSLFKLPPEAAVREQ